MLDFKKIIMPVSEVQSKLTSLNLKNRNTNNLEQAIFEIKNALESDSKNYDQPLDDLIRDFARKNHLFDEPPPKVYDESEINNDPKLSRLAKDRILRMKGFG